MVKKRAAVKETEWPELSVRITWHPGVGDIGTKWVKARIVSRRRGPAVYRSLQFKEEGKVRNLYIGSCHPH